jgi:hypothetical protein
VEAKAVLNLSRNRVGARAISRRQCCVGTSRKYEIELRRTLSNIASCESEQAVQCPELMTAIVRHHVTRAGEVLCSLGNIPFGLNERVVGLIQANDIHKRGAFPSEGL